MELELLLKNVHVVRPSGDGAEDIDIGIRDGRIASLEAGISPDSAPRCSMATVSWCFRAW